jgi:hypothetical protein
VRDRQPQKANRQLAELAMQTAAISAPASAESFGTVGPVVTGSIPTSMGAPGGVVVGFATVTPKTTGNYFVKAGVVTGANQNGGAQAFNLQFAVQAGGSPPTVGTTRILPSSTFAAAIANSGDSSTPTVGGIIGGAVVGQTTYICLVAAQGAAGAFALAANSGWIEAQEIGT